MWYLPEKYFPQFFCEGANTCYTHFLHVWILCTTTLRPSLLSLWLRVWDLPPPPPPHQILATPLNCIEEIAYAVVANLWEYLCDVCFLLKKLHGLYIIYSLLWERGTCRAALYPLHTEHIMDITLSLNIPMYVFCHTGASLGERLSLGFPFGGK